MPAELPSPFVRAVAALPPKTKQPASAAILNNWIAQAETRLGPEARAGRLGWLVASSVAIAAVQRAVDSDAQPLFLLKGGTWLQHRLNVTARTTKDVDGLIRGDIDTFLQSLETVLAMPWGPLTLRRGPVEIIDVPHRVLRPRRFDIILELRGVTWRRVQFEISPDEAGISHAVEAVDPTPLNAFGLPDPAQLTGIALRYQIAQKFHAVTDPHDPPNSINDRARDIPDLLLLRDLARNSGAPTLNEIRAASVAVFAARASEAVQLGRAPRPWPPVLTAYPHWTNDYQRAIAAVGLHLDLPKAVHQTNTWIAEIDAAID